MRYSASILACLAAILLAACEKKTSTGSGPAGPATPATDPFPVRFTWAPAAGTKEEAEFRTSMKADMKVRANGRDTASQADEVFEFAFAEETLKADGRAATECRRVFTKATRTNAGKKSNLGVQGKSLWGKLDPDGVWTWTAEGGAPLSEIDYAAMSEGLGRRGGGTGKDGGVVDEAFGSGRAVKVGDTWRADAAALAKLYVDPDTGIDPAASKATFRLASAEKRGDAIHGTVEMEIDFAVTKTVGGTLNEPLHFVLKGTVTGCLDGSTSDARLDATLTMKGKRTLTRQGTDQTMDADFDLEIRIESSRRLVK